MYMTNQKKTLKRLQTLVTYPDKIKRLLVLLKQNPRILNENERRSLLKKIKETLILLKDTLHNQTFKNKITTFIYSNKGSKPTYKRRTNRPKRIEVEE